MFTYVAEDGTLRLIPSPSFRRTGETVYRTLDKGRTWEVYTPNSDSWCPLSRSTPWLWRLAAKLAN
jgi:hypothetical protein